MDNIQNNENNFVSENDKKGLDELKQKLESLKAKEEYIAELGNFSKNIYFSSIPVMLIFTAFIESIGTHSFDIVEYLILNGITAPVIFLANNFICGTSKSRKHKLVNIDGEIKSTESEISELSRKIINSNSPVKSIDNSRRIKPIDRTYDFDNSKALSKTLNKKI